MTGLPCPLSLSLSLSPFLQSCSAPCIITRVRRRLGRHKSYGMAPQCIATLSSPTCRIIRILRWGKCNFETSPNFPHKTTKTTFHFLNSDAREIFPGVTIPSFPPTSRSVMCTFGNFLPEGARLARSREGACACACMMGIRFRRSLALAEPEDGRRDKLSLRFASFDDDPLTPLRQWRYFPRAPSCTAPRCVCACARPRLENFERHIARQSDRRGRPPGRVRERMRVDETDGSPEPRQCRQ